MLTLQVDVPRSILPHCINSRPHTQSRLMLHLSGISQGHGIVPTTIIYAEIFSPASIGTDTFESVCPGATTVGTLHGEWVDYQCWITSLQVGVLAKLAATHLVYNSTRPDKHMEVWAYSGYSGIGIYPAGINSYLGAVKMTWGSTGRRCRLQGWMSLLSATANKTLLPLGQRCIDSMQVARWR